MAEMYPLKLLEAGSPEPAPSGGSDKEFASCYVLAYHTIALISHASKVMLEILQARLQQYVNCELSDVQTGFRKDRGTRDQIANICWIIEKARQFQKTSTICINDYAKAFDCVDHNKLRKYQMGTPGKPASWEICMQVKKHQLELDIEQQTGSK